MTEALAQGKIAVNPCKGVRLPRRDDHTTLDEHVYLDPTEVRLIASELPKWCAHIPMLLADTGLRWGELTALQVGDVDILDGTLRVGRAWKRQENGSYLVGMPKSQRSRRTVAPGEDALDILTTLTAGRRSTELVVTAPDGISRLPRSTFMRHWTRALYGSGTMATPNGGLVGTGALEKQPHIHSLRHTHASWLISHGASPAFVQAQLGHEDISTTMRIYAHLMPNTREEIRSALRRAKQTGLESPEGVPVPR
jgi:integrase